MDKSSISEDETVTPVLRDVELVTKKLYSFGKDVFLGTANQIRALLLFTIKKIIILLVAGALGGTSAYIYSKQYKNPFESYLIIKSNINTWEQLASDVRYVNSLIAEEQTETLSKLLTISKEEALKLQEIDIKPSATYSQKVGLIEKLNTHMDSSTLSKVDYDRLMKFDDMAFTESYVVTVRSSDGAIFGSIEKPLLAYFESSPILKEKLERKQSKLQAQKEMYQKKLSDLDTLENVLNQAILASAESGNSKQTTSISLSEDPQSSPLSPIDVSEKYISYHQELVDIEESLKLFDSSYEIKSHFNRYGTETGLSTPKKVIYSALYAKAVAFFLLLLLQFLKKKPLDA